jgi:hypothetical protein
MNVEGETIWFLSSFLFFFLWILGFELRALHLARQVLYHLSQSLRLLRETIWREEGNQGEERVDRRG